MRVSVVDIYTTNISTLRDVVRLGISEEMRPKVAGIWSADSPEGGFAINIFGPFVISCDCPPLVELAWQYPLIKEPA